MENLSAQKQAHEVMYDEPHDHGQTSPMFDKTVKAGAVGVGVGLGGGFLSEMWMSNKLFNFNSAVLKKTREDIMGRGTGASTAPGNLNGLAAGMSNREIEEANRYIVAEEKEFSLARRVMKLGGRTTVSTIAAAGTGLIAFLGAMALIPKRREHEEAYSAQVRLPNGFKIVSADAPAAAEVISEKKVEPEVKNWRDDVQKQAAEKAAAEPSVASR